MNFKSGVRDKKNMLNSGMCFLIYVGGNWGEIKRNEPNKQTNKNNNNNNNNNN